VLWEHVVLETLVAAGLARLQFWRDKQDREVDFVVPRRGDVVDAIECKWRADAFETRGLRAFRAIHPKGQNYVVSPIEGGSYRRTVDAFHVAFVSPADLARVFA
jgi:predicted AAA+ superfamily ATPase